MQVSFSVAKKLCALILSLLVIIGSIPLSYAASPAQQTEPTKGESTPDEAQEPSNSQDNVSEEYPNMTVNDGVKSYKDSLGNMYFTGKSLNEITVKTKPASDLFSSLSNDIAENKDSITVILKDSLNNEYSLGSDSNYSTENNNLFTAIIKLANKFKDGLESGEYTLNIKYRKDDNDHELFNKKFKIVNDNPKISDIQYNGQANSSWSDKDVTVNFNVDSEIIKSVSVDDAPATGSNGSYSFTATESGKHVIKATDELDHSSSSEIEVFVDKTAPEISEPVFLDAEEKEVSAWTNKPLKVKVDIIEKGSGIDASALTVNGEAPASSTANENGITLTFNADERKDFVISCKDKVGNEASKTIQGDSILIDKEAPKAKDFTLSFEKAENTGDKVLEFLTFGAYSNTDINVTVDVDDNNMSETDGNSIMLYDGDNALDKVPGKGNVFVLKAPENDGESHSFDLKVIASDTAGNTPEDKFSVAKDDVRTRISEDDVKALKDMSEKLYEIVISKVVPAFNENKIDVDFEKKTENGDDTYVTGDGKLVVTAEESISGLKKVTAKLGDKDAELKLTPDTTDKNEKVKSIKAEMELSDLKSGTYKAVFTAEGNSGMKSEIETEFKVDNEGPKFKDDTFEYSNAVENTQIWSNSDVEVSFELSDSTDVSKIKAKYYNSSKVNEPEDKDYTDIEMNGAKGSFTVNEYGKYTVVVEDALGNTSKLETENIKYDNTEPEVVDNKFEYSKDWTNGSVTVSFKAKDNPENNSGIEQILIDDTIKATKTEDGYSFPADSYGEYKVSVYDNAKNVFNTTVFVDSIDKIAPSFEKVEFSEAKNKKNYGIYSNEALTMTLTVLNELNADNKGSELDKVEIRENGEAVASSFKNEKDNTYTIEYVITPDNNIHNFSFYAKDKAGNEVTRDLKDPDLPVIVDESAEASKKMYEVVVTEQTAKIGVIGVQFSGKNKIVDGNVVYSGDGTFTATIKDTLSGIDSYKAYFIEKSLVETDSSGVITNLESFTPVDESKLSDDDNKVTEKKITFNSTAKGVLKSGEYVVAVLAENLSGNKIQRSTGVTVDNAPPAVTAFEISVNGGNKDTVNSKGIYTAGKVNVTVKCTDGAYSAGIKTIQLYNNDIKIGENSTGNFTLSDYGVYNLKAVVIDNNGNELGAPEDLRTKQVKVNGKDLDIDKNCFEIVCNTKSDDTKYSEPDYNFTYKGNNVYKSEEGKDAIIVVPVENTVSGIKSVTTKILNSKGAAVAADTPYFENQKNEKNTKFDPETDFKLVSEDVCQDVSKLSSGKYKLEITLTDNSGVITVKNFEFGIDKAAPTVESISFEKGNSSGDNLLNLLTFGLYSSESIKVTVKVFDEDPSSGVDTSGIVLSSEKGKSVTEDKFAQISGSNEGEPNIYEKVFYLNVDDKDGSKFNYNDLQVTATDIFGNTKSKPYYQSNNIFEGKEYQPNKTFDIVASKQVPQIGEFSYDKGTYLDGVFCSSGGPIISFNVNGKASKLHSVQVQLNGVDVSSYCTADGSPLPAQFTDFENVLDKSKNQEVQSVDVSLNTSELNNLLNKNGENELTVSATGNNNLQSESKTVKFKVFTIKPTIKEGSIKYNTNWTNDKKVPVEFTAVAGNNNNYLTKIEIFTKKDGVETSFTSKEYDVSKKLTSIDFSFAAEHYGVYYAKLTDFVGNTVDVEIGEIKIDHSKPSIEKIKLDPIKDMGYGGYSNQSVKMTVFINNAPDIHGGQSPLDDNDAVSVTVNDATPDFEGRNPGTNEFVFTIKPLEEIKNDQLHVIFNLKDKAGNEINDLDITKGDVEVEVNNIVRKNFEILSTLQTPQINIFKAEFSTNGWIDINPPINGSYKGDGKFTATISEDPSGIDKYYAYFLRTRDLPKDFDTSKPDKVDELLKETPTKSETDISKKEKVTNQIVTFKSFDEGKLKSDDYTAIVVAYNLNGNRIAKRLDIHVENEVPTVTKVNITTSTEEESVTNITEKGVYSNKPVSISFETAVGAYNLPVVDVKLSNSGKTDNIFKEEETGKYVLNIPEGEKTVVYKDLRALAIDNNNNRALVKDENGDYVKDENGDYVDNPQKFTDLSIFVNGNLLGEKLGDFEIVINSDVNKIHLGDSNEEDADDFEYDFVHSDSEDYKNHIFDNQDGNTVKGEITARFTNETSGIYNVSLAVTNSNNQSIDVEKLFSVDKNEDTTDDNGKIVQRKASFDASELSSGTYTIVFTVTDYCGVTREFSNTIKIDNTPPQINSIVYQKIETGFDKFLNVVTFGLYSNTSIKVTVNVTDASPSVGLNGDAIKLYHNDKKLTADINNNAYSKSFTLSIGKDETDSFYNDLRVEVSDKFNNRVEDSVKAFNNYLNSAKEDNLIYIENQDSFDIVSTSNKPVISMDIASRPNSTAYSEKGEGSNVKETSGRFFADKPIVNFTATDNVSKLSKVTATIQHQSENTKKDITEYITITSGDTSDNTIFSTKEGKITTINNNLGLNKDVKDDQYVKTLSCSIDTAATGYVTKDGKYTVEIIVVSNNGNKDTTYMDFNYDSTNPVITRYEFRDELGKVQSEEKIKSNADKINYSYFLRRGSKITISANDNVVNGVIGSGTKTIVLELTDYDNSDKPKIISKDVDANSTAVFTLDADFRGHLKAYAIDNVKNNSNGSQWYSPDNVVAELDSTFDKNTGASFDYNLKANHTDAFNNKLFNSSGLVVSIDAWSNYAGVKTVNVYVSGDKLPEAGLLKTISVDHAGNVTNGSAAERFVDNGKTTNLVTKVHSTIPITHDVNSYEIKLVITDNAGNEKEVTNEKFSVDTTRPTVSVVQSPDQSQGNHVGSDVFFNRDVTLDITVTEVNFDPSQFIPKITNTDGTIPTLVQVSEWRKMSSRGTTVHKARFVFHNDGDYTFDCSFTDMAGHRNTENNSKKFTVDQTKPVINEITYQSEASDAYKPYFNKDRTAIITIHEHNFYDTYVTITPNLRTVDGWKSIGNDNYQARILFHDDGTYSFTVDFKDKALNVAVQAKSEQFHIDQHIKAPTFKNVENKKAYKDKEFKPEVLFEDDNIASPTQTTNRDGAVFKDGTYKYVSEVVNGLTSNTENTSTRKTIVFDKISEIEENDGIYTVTAVNKDKAGNEKSAKIMFSVNRFGPTFLIDDAKTKETLDKFYTNNCPDIIVSVINVNQLKESEVDIKHDEGFLEISKGDDYKVTDESGKANSWYERRYTFDKKNFDNEGNYNVVVTSKNEFGVNKSNRNAYHNNKIDRRCPINFVVDKTKPNIKITGVEDGKPYSEAEKNVNIVCNDINISPESFKVTFDDKDQKLNTKTEGIKVEGDLTLRADGNDGERNLSVSIVDKAGNKSTKAVEKFHLSASWIAMLLYYYWPLLIGIGAGIAALAALFIFLKNRKKKQSAG